MKMNSNKKLNSGSQASKKRLLAHFLFLHFFSNASLVFSAENAVDPAQATEPPNAQSQTFSKAEPPGSPSEPLTAATPVKETDASDEATELDSASSFLLSIAGNNGTLLPPEDSVTVADISTPITIQDAVAFALHNNYEAQAAQEKIRSAHWDKMGAYAQYLPTLSYTTYDGVERSRPGAFNDSTGNRVADDSHDRRDRQFNFNQPIVNLSIISDILVNKDREKIANEEQRDTIDGVAFDTISAYLDLLQTRLSMRLAEEYKSYLDSLADRMKTRVELGGAAGPDLDRIQSRAAIAESARIEAQGFYQTNIATFKRLTRITPSALTLPKELVPEIPENMDSAVDKAIVANPTYISSLKKIDLARHDSYKSYSGLVPKLSLNYNNSYAWDAGGVAHSNPVDGVPPTARTHSLMLVAEWSVGGSSLTSGLSGQAKEREMQFHSMDLRANLEQSVVSSYTAINSAHRRQEVLKKNVTSDRKVVAGFEEQYKLGSRSLFDVLDAYEQLYNSRLNLLRVTVANAKAAYQIRRLMGEIGDAIVKE